jgi:hypothetical protein
MKQAQRPRLTRIRGGETLLRCSLTGVEEMLANEFASADTSRAGEDSTADMRGKLVEQIELRHVFKDF